MTSMRSRTGSTVALGLLLVALLAFPDPVFASSDLDFRIKPESDELTAQLILHDLEEALNSPTEAGLERVTPAIADWNVQAEVRQSRMGSVLSELTADSGRVWVQPSRVQTSGDSVVVYAQVFHEANGRLFRDSTQFVFRREVNSKGKSTSSVRLVSAETILDQVRFYRSVAQAGKRWAVPSTSTEERTPLLGSHPDSISHHMLVQKDVSSSLDVTTLSASTKGTVAGLNVDLFNQPFGLWPFYYEEYLGGTTTKRFSFLACSDASWDRIIVSGRAHHGSGYNILNKFCSNGEGNWEVRRPTGIAWSYWSLFVADSYNDRVQQFTYNTLSDPPEVTFDRTIDYDFDTPIDVAGAELWTWSGDDLFKTVAILDQGNNRVCVEWTNGYAPQHAFYPNPTINFSLDHPTSVCFGRNRWDHANNQRLYVADAGNNRVVSFVHQKPYPTCVLVCTTPAGFFPEDAYLSSVEVDDYGDVYVLDGNNSTVYKFDWSLTEFYGKFGSRGTGPQQFTYPHRLAIMHSARYATSGEQVSYGNVGEAVVSEMWTADSGIRRYDLSYDVLASDFSYHPGCMTYTGDPSRDYLILRWFQSGTAFGTVEVTQGTGADSILTLPDTYFPAGERLCYVMLEDEAPDGQYNYQVNLRSPFDITDTRTITGSLAVSRHIDSSCSPLHPYGLDSAFIEPADRSGCTGPECDRCLYPSGATRTVRVYAYDSTMGAPVDENYHFTWTAPSNLDLKYLCYGPHSVDSILMWYECDTAVTDEPWVQFRLSGSIFHWGSSGHFGPILYVTIDRNSSSSNQLEGRRDIGTTALGSVVGEPLAVRSYLYSTYAATPCYRPPSCPFLYASDGDGYQFVNNILPQSEFSADTVSDLQDYYPIGHLDQIDSTYYKLMITEEEQEKTKLQNLDLLAFDIPLRLNDFCFDSDQEVMFLIDSLAPVYAVDNKGLDVTKDLVSRDGAYYEGVGSGWVDVTYDLHGGGGQGALSSRSQDIPAIVADPSLPAKESKRSPNTGTPFGPSLYGISVQDESGEWQLKGNLYPRVESVRQGITVPSATLKGQLKIRFSWTGSVAIDVLHCFLTERARSEPVKLRLVEAKHTREGIVTNKVDRDDGLKQVLVPGDSLFLTYYAEPPSRGTQRVFAFSTKGNYRTLTDKELSQLENPTSAAFSFEQNYPNPFNPVTTFNFALPSPQRVRLEVYNVLGQKVVTLIDGPYSAGSHTFEWNSSTADGSPVASGVYLAKFTAGDFQASRKMVVVK